MTGRIFININQLKTKMNYNTQTGSLTWTDNFFKKRIGKEVGSINKNGYKKTTIKGQTLLCHRIAWAIYYNEQPPEIIDHIDGDRTNNRISNLRSSNYSENAENQRRAMASNKTSKYLGVSKFKGRWRAKIKVKNKYVFLGYHDSEELARDAYLKYKRENHTACSI